jgi:hypothetical protein
MTEDAAAKLPPGIWKIAAVAIVGAFLSQLDATVVNVSLPTLAVELRSSLSTIQWVMSGYLLGLALMLPLNSWLVACEDPSWISVRGLLSARTSTPSGSC